MKKFRYAASALALMLGCLPLAACGDDTPNAALPPEEELFEPLDPEDTNTTNPAEEEPPVVEPPVIEPPAEEEPPVAEPPEAEPKEPEPPVEETPVGAEYLLIRTDGLNIRSGAGTAYSSLGTAEKGTLFQFVKRSGNWYETRYQGRTVYISADERYTAIVALQTGNEAVENVIGEGLRFMGVPYVYGAVRYHDGNGNKLSGFTESAFDCSSLMQYIFYRGANTLLGVTTRTQVLQGTEVTKEDIQRGDLLFFTNASRKNNVGIERVGHVALYLGDNYILHTASDYAKVEQISATRWSYYITARRFL